MTEINITPVNADAAVNAVRYAVKSLGTWAAYVADNGVTRETVADHARALAALAFPKDEPIQKSDGKRTRFGNAVQAAGNGMRRALDDTDDKGDDNTDKPVVLRASLSGEGGGTVTIPADHPLYAAVVEMIRGNKSA